MKTVRRVVEYLVGVFIALFLLSLAFIFTIAQYRQEIKKADAILVLGAAINTPALYNRSIQGLKLFQQDKADLLILSGGRISDQDISEADYMQKVISQNAGMPLKIILEEESHNTYENIRNSKAKASEVKSIIIVSDKFHLARAFLLAKRQGFSPVYWSFPEEQYYNFKESVYYHLREAVAIIAYIPKFVLNK